MLVLKALKIGLKFIFTLLGLLMLGIFLIFFYAFIYSVFFKHYDNSLLFATEVAFTIMEDKCPQYGCNPHDFKLVKKGPCGGWELWFESAKNEGIFSRVYADGEGFITYYKNIPQEPIFDCEEDAFIRSPFKNSELPLNTTRSR